MTFLPIVERELRVAARRTHSYRTRTLVAFITCVVVSGILITAGQFPTPMKMGQSLFKLLSSLAFVYCLLEGARNTADCLSEEKREGTLGLLFLTDLKGYDVVLGKLLATSLNSFYCLVAVFPAFAISLMLGGVTPGEFWRMVLVLTNTLFLSLCTAMWISSISQDARKAWGAALGLMLAILLGPWLVDCLIAFSIPKPSNAVFSVLSPFVAAELVYDVEYNAGPAHFWWSFFLIQLLSWGFLGLASWTLPKAWKTTAAIAAQGATEPSRLKQWILKHGLLPHRGRSRWLLESNPVLWLVGRNEPQRRWLWMLVGFTACGALAIWFAIDENRKDLGQQSVVAVLAIHLIFRIWVAAQACHSLAEARNSGTLDLMFSTPLTTSEIIQGQFLALKRLFSGPVIAILALEAAFLFGQLLSGADTAQDVFRFFLMGVILAWSMACFVADLFAVAWVGMWFGLTSRKMNQAVMKTLFCIVALPWLALFLIPFVGLVAWVFSPIVALSWISWAQNKLTGQLRLVVAQRTDLTPSPEGWWPFVRWAVFSRIAQILKP
jgi:ABC-type transport system involved in multi-copper enzyme maturation permease subunit